MAKLPAIIAKSEKVSALGLKQMILEKAKPLVKQYIKAALGTGELESTSAQAREEIWSIIKELILKSSDQLDININKAEDILKAVSDGKCTVKEGEDLLNLYKKMADITASERNSIPLGGGSSIVVNVGMPGESKPTPIEVKHEVIEND